jgi:hypothetical protein
MEVLPPGVKRARQVAFYSALISGLYTGAIALASLMLVIAGLYQESPILLSMFVYLVMAIGLSSPLIAITALAGMTALPLIWRPGDVKIGLFLIQLLGLLAAGLVMWWLANEGSLTGR